MEVAHEALLREWPRLLDWLAEDRELLQAVDVLAESARRWDEGGRADEDLLRGARLERAADLATTAPSQLRATDLGYIAASIKTEQAERDAARRGRLRLRLLAASVGAALVIAVMAGGIAVLQQTRVDEEARAAASAQLQADLATLLRSSTEADPTTGILLALEAQRRAPSAETDRALLVALARASGGRTIESFEPLPADACSAIWSGWVSRDGTMQTAAVNGVAVTRDLVSGEVTEHFPMPGRELCRLVRRRCGRSALCRVPRRGSALARALRGRVGARDQARWTELGERGRRARRVADAHRVARRGQPD